MAVPCILLASGQGIYGTVPLVGATIPLAVGAGLASKIRQDGNVAITFFGDGATEEGHFHESLNLAALYRLPVVFVCENNFYSTHMALSERRPKDNIVESADLYGMPGFGWMAMMSWRSMARRSRPSHVREMDRGRLCWNVGRIDGVGTSGRPGI